MISRSNAAEHRNGFDANPSAAATHLHDDLAGGVHRESSARRSYSLGTWTVTRQHIELLAGGSPSYLSPFLINFYRGMNLLTAEESRTFPMRNVEQEEEELVLANEVNLDLEGEPRSSPQ